MKVSFGNKKWFLPSITTTWVYLIYKQFIQPILVYEIQSIHENKILLKYSTLVRPISCVMQQNYSFVALKNKRR
jgi:hypothetical protein